MRSLEGRLAETPINALALEWVSSSFLGLGKRALACYVCMDGCDIGEREGEEGWKRGRDGQTRSGSSGRRMRSGGIWGIRGGGGEVVLAAAPPG